MPVRIALLLLLAFSGSIQAKDYIVVNTSTGLNESVVKEITRGVKREVGVSMLSYNPNTFAESLSGVHPNDRIISLGIEPYMFLKLLDTIGEPPARIIFGAYVEPSVAPGVSLRINPAKLFESLQNVSPNIKTLKTVVSDTYNNAHLEVFKKEAKKKGITLEILKAATPTEMAAQWKIVFDSIDSHETGLALIDTTFMEVIGGLRYVLKTAWKKNAVVVTTVQSYTARGVSIGIALNIVGYGTELASSLESKSEKEIFTQSYSPAINLRHLKHAGASVKTSDFTLPVVFIER